MQFSNKHELNTSNESTDSSMDKSVISRCFTSGSVNAHGMDMIDGVPKSNYGNVPIGLLKCTVCDSTMTDGPVRFLCNNLIVGLD